MEDRVNDLSAQLEAYIQDTRTQIGVDAARESYWRGVLFGLELALLEARKAHAAPEPLPTQPEPAATGEFYSAVNELVFDYLSRLIELYEVRIKRELLVYNARVTRHELLKAIRRAAHIETPSEQEMQANPDLPQS